LTSATLRHKWRPGYGCCLKRLGSYVPEKSTTREIGGEKYGRGIYTLYF
jgi:hypothetical protein